jgi:hypothetical protein
MFCYFFDRCRNFQFNDRHPEKSMDYSKPTLLWNTEIVKVTTSKESRNSNRYQLWIETKFNSENFKHFENAWRSMTSTESGMTTDSQEHFENPSILWILPCSAKWIFTRPKQSAKPSVPISVTDGRISTNCIAQSENPLKILLLWFRLFVEPRIQWADIYKFPQLGTFSENDRSQLSASRQSSYSFNPILNTQLRKSDVHMGSDPDFSQSQIKIQP